MRTSTNGKTYTMEFDSVDEIGQFVKEKHSDARILEDLDNPRYQDEYFGGVGSRDQIWEMARVGWDKDVDAVMKIAEDTIDTVEREFDVKSWTSIHDVSGTDVDIDRFLTGIPENMVSYQMIDTTRTGRVISLAVNVSASAMVSAQTIAARGKCVVALVYALEKLGIRTEIYADFQASGGDKYARISTMVKHATDMLDPAMVMFALVHASFMRGLDLPAMHAFPAEWRQTMGVGGTYGYPTKDLDASVYPEGTIMVPSAMYGAWDSRKAEEYVTTTLKELGLIEA